MEISCICLCRWTAFLLLRDEFDGWIQGAVVPIAGEMLSGVHRARFNPVDGQLYVSGMAGWGTYTTQDGCLQRIRYTGGEETQLPIDFHIHENGIRVSFSQPVDHSVVVQTANHFRASMELSLQRCLADHQSTRIANWDWKKWARCDFHSVRHSIGRKSRNFP